MCSSGKSLYGIVEGLKTPDIRTTSPCVGRAPDSPCEVLQDSASDLRKLRSIRLRNPKNVLISYININSIRNKFHDLQCLVGNLVDVITVAETKIDSSFPRSQFVIDGFCKPYRLDGTSNSGGVMTFVRTDILSRRLEGFSFHSDMQIIPVELNLRKQKWLLLNIYRPPKQNTKFFLSQLSDALEFYSEYDKVLMNGDFNLEPTNPVLTEFLITNCLYNHMREKTCWKSSTGSCIDLILSNSKRSLMHTGTVETGLSDHHSLIYTFLRTQYVKLPPVKINYRKYSDFNDDLFLQEVSEVFKNSDILNYSRF